MLNNFMKNKYIILGIIIVVLIGGGIYLLVGKSPTKQQNETQQALDDVAVSIPQLDFSSSPLPDLNVSSLNVAAPKINTGNIFTAPTIGSNFSFTPDVNFDIATPTIPTDSFNFSMPKNIPTVPSSNTGAGSTPSGMPTNIPTTTPPPSGGQGGAPSVDCSMFASVPSCSMTGPGEAMCKQCFPNK
jgi:hypothetical protein